MNLPNILSISRIFLVLPIIYLFEYELYFVSLGVFIVASITDYLDGYFARKSNQTSNVGALLDLLADKVFVSILLIWMTFNFESLLILISTILIVSREISISYLRLFIVSQSKNMDEIRSDLIGKYKTTFQMLGLGFLLISPLLSSTFFNVSLGLIFFSAFMSWYSLARYLKQWIV